MSDQNGSWRKTSGQTNGGRPDGGNGSSRGSGIRGKSTRGRAINGKGGGRSTQSQGVVNSNSKQAAPSSSKVLPNLPPPMHNQTFFRDEYHDVFTGGKIKQEKLVNSKNPLQTYVSARTGKAPSYEAQEGFVGGGRESSIRVTVMADEMHNIVGYGDAKTQKEAEKLAALHAILQLVRSDLYFQKVSAATKAAVKEANKKEAATNLQTNGGPTGQLQDGTKFTVENARQFIDFYCTQFHFGRPEISLQRAKKGSADGKRMVQKDWKATMVVGGAALAEVIASTKKSATANIYLEAVSYIVSHDLSIWKTFTTQQQKPSASTLTMGNVPHVIFNMSEELDDEVRSTYEYTRESLLFANRPRPAGFLQAGEAADTTPKSKQRSRDERNKVVKVSSKTLEEKSAKLLQDLEDYQVSEKMSKMRSQRNGLPVYQKATDVLVKIELNQITIVMAATGSGKTTQIPQILFDDYIMQNQGANCNIICTQPRRIAAISVAERVAKERGESIGSTVGYQVRFENKAPQPNGSITFCTTGVFLRRLQSALGDEESSNTFLDSLTHIILDEVHERDLETDLLLVVLKRLLAERKRMNKREIKLVLMSATIDPKMFCEYFADSLTGTPAPVVEVSGRSFPVQRHYLEETYHELDSLRLPPRAGGWVWAEKNVREYLDRELSPNAGMDAGMVKNGNGENKDFVDDLEIPYPLVALMIADVLARSDDGHVLCFLPGWDEIKNVHAILEDTAGHPLMEMNFNDRDRYEIHILHSSIPVADQQAIFEPVRKEGIRRIILSTNIAETSVTIPDVVYVIDTGRVKESRYDPERHLSSLVSAWVGTSNINQRAGRAGRHRPGEAYAIFSKARYDRLNVSSTVEMKRVDLSNVVMHIKALDIPGMDVEDVLNAAIEPPASERVTAAMDKLVLVGALDANRDLTSLGRVLLQLPVDAPIGKMCLYGAFFRCLDPALTLAAVLTNRDPWMAPLPLKDEAGAIKNSWSLPHFRSDPLVTLRAYTHWDEMMKRGSQWEASKFCNENFLGRITLGQIQQVKEHLFQSIEKAGILEAVLGNDGNEPNRGPKRRPPFRRRVFSTMPELNANSHSTTLLAALIALASVPNFAVRTRERVYRTSQDKSTQIHPSSVQHVKHTKQEEDYRGERVLFAFNEKIKNVSQAGGGPGGPTMLRNVTRLDPLTYMLFGTKSMRPTVDGGVLCDDWLPIQGNFDALDDVDRLKAILDVCMLRVFEAIQPEGGAEGNSPKRLQGREVQEFERLTMSIVRILDGFSRERIESESRGSTRPATPLANGGGGGGGSGRNTPFHQQKQNDYGGVGLRF